MTLNIKVTAILPKNIGETGKHVMMNDSSATCQQRFETCFKRCLEGGRSLAVLGDPGNDYHVMCMYIYIYVHRCLMSPMLFGEWGGSHH